MKHLLTNSIYWYHIKKLIPSKYYDTWLSAFYKITTPLYRGTAKKCPLCQNTFSRFPGGNYGSCPACGAGSRHRMLYLFLKLKTDLFTRQQTFLHFAPEFCFFRQFKSLNHFEYISGDLDLTRAEYRVDITRIPYPENYFDVVMSSHVLEHIDDEKQALNELYRVQKPGGWAIHLVPLDTNRETTFEDDSIRSPKERKKIFGHFDHKRIYGLDYKQRLEASGFQVEFIPVKEFIDDHDCEYYSLDPNEFIVLCKKG